MTERGAWLRLLQDDQTSIWAVYSLSGWPSDVRSTADSGRKRTSREVVEGDQQTSV